MTKNKDLYKLYVGADESNHGQFPEINVAVRSKLERDVGRKKMHRKKKNFTPQPMGQNRDYSFLLFNKADQDRIPRVERFGTIIASLLVEDIKPKELEELNIYLDGGWRKSYLIYTRDYVSEVTQVPRDIINVNCEADLDGNMPLVNFAHYRAKWIFQNWTPAKMAKSAKKRELLK